MELHFCSQCGISIPLSEVQNGVAVLGEGRYACAEHRTSKDTPELLFCANCQVSIPVGDTESGRARREFGSLLCAPCSSADAAERERRRKAVEAEMAGDAPAPATATPRTCSVCSAAVPDAVLASGRALVDGLRIVCPRCRDAAAVGAARAPAESSSSGGTWVLAGLLVVAAAAAGFFGAEYVNRRAAPQVPTASAADLRALRDDTSTLREQVRRMGDDLASRPTGGGVTKESLEVLQKRFADDLLATREDLAELRTRTGAADGELAQRIAKLEGQILGLQEMIRGLAARPAASGPETPVQPPVAQSPDGPAPGMPAPPAPEPKPGVPPEVQRLIRDLLESRDEATRFAAASELVRRKERFAIPAFARQAVEDPNLIVRRACARGLGDTRAWFGVPALIQALEDKEAYVAQQANYALLSITGQDFGVTVESSVRDRKTRAANATKWWEKNRETPPDGVILDPVTLDPPSVNK